MTVLFSFGLARTIAHVCFQGKPHGEVMPSVPYMSGFIFPIVVILFSFSWQTFQKLVQAVQIKGILIKIQYEGYISN